MEEVKVVPEAYSEALKKGKTTPKSLHYCSLTATWPNARVKRVVAMSDIHGATHEVVASLIKRGIIDKDTVVICTGDMGGADGKMGGVLDPTPDYLDLRKAAAAFYFVQGNHDADQTAVHRYWRNADRTPCYLHRRVVQTTLGLGTIGGVSGIIAGRKEPDPSCHIYEKPAYDGFLRSVMEKRPEVLLTHTPLDGRDLDCRVHLFGHAHAHENHAVVDDQGRLKLNMDCRIFVWE